MHLRGYIALLSAAVCGCSGCGDEDGTSDVADAGDTLVASDGRTMEKAVTIIDELRFCDVSHRGLVLDLGGEAMLGRYGWQLAVPSGIVSAEHDGASWARIYERKVTLNFYLPDSAPIFISLRGIGRDARRIEISIDDFLLGTVKLAKDEIRIVSTRKTGLPMDAGLHRVTLRFRGRKRSDAEPYGEIDWVRIGIPDEIERTFGAPTLANILVPAAHLGNVPHRALGMRGPSSVRCTLRVPKGGRFRASLGMRGSGSGVAAVMVRQDGKDPTVLERVEVEGGDDATWSDVEIPLSAYEGQIISLEMAALKTGGTGRLLFGDPMVLVPTAPTATTPKAKAAVVVILDGVSRDDLPPWRDTETPHLATLNRLAREATVFDEHRAASSLVSASTASLLSGVSPHWHTLADSGARLPSTVTTLGGVARDASVRAAMFTGVPMSFEPLGFANHWDHFKQYPPNGLDLASAPLEDAATWLTEAPVEGEEARALLGVVHTRGGHPPFELTPTEAALLPPPDYAGFLKPRDVAIDLVKVRARTKRMNDLDRERLRAMYFASLSRQDAALGELIRALEEAGRWESTLLVVTGDVASARESLFLDGGPLDESALTLPLYVHFPNSEHGSTRVGVPTELYDITHTAQAALSLTPRPVMLGRDLASLVSNPYLEEQRVRVAFLDHDYAARWGDFSLRGTIGKTPMLCHLLRDPTCAVDRSTQHPIVAQSIFRHLVKFAQPGLEPPTREPVTIDSEFAAMLKVWGAY